MNLSSAMFTDKTVLYGTRAQRFIREFTTHSGIFWLFDTVSNIGVDGVLAYITYPPQWVMLIAALVQSWIISRDERGFHWWYVFIAPTLYTIVDIGIEGWSVYFAESYHIFYWIWAALMGIAYRLNHSMPALSVFLRAVLLAILLPAIYFFAELENGVILDNVSDLTAYWFDDSAHFFILFGAIVLGVVLGTINLLREHFEKLLYDLATYFEEIASWSFDKSLIQQAYHNHDVLQLRRIERTVLFMDIRGFTSWSEAHQPDEVVQIVNVFYQTAEAVIKEYRGFKIQMTGDEIMTRFDSPEAAVQAALQIQSKVAAVLKPFGLSAGIGIHTGEVVEGLVGGKQTRQYGIFGDTVNTAARLQSQARANEIVISDVTWQRIRHVMPFKDLPIEKRLVTLKGKADPMLAIVIQTTLPPLKQRASQATHPTMLALSRDKTNQD
ncbi:MAG: hypothetical protein CUN55_07830 [Phototrophicales bacterium]|nr:MAG: hypothetical protein CUN55_07830 [Phototrophicales bacterium]